MMQPNDQQQQYPMNYLDTIATPQPVKTVNPLFLWAMIGGVLVFAVVVIMAVLGGSNPTDKVTRFGARMSDLQTVSMDSQEKIKSGQLRTLNSGLSLILTNANRELKEPLTALGIEIDNEKQRTVALVATETTELNERLEDARLNAVFDRTYAREIAFYLKSLRTEMREIYGSTKSDELQAVLQDTEDNLAPLLTSFSSFNED